jgi:hypothetical protein
MAYKLDGQLQAHLGRNLKAVYQPVVEEALPERLRNLLDAIDRNEVETSSGKIASSGRSPSRIEGCR